jgi:hypothetical protein
MPSAGEVRVDPVPTGDAAASVVHLRHLFSRGRRRGAVTPSTKPTPSPQCQGPAAMSFVCTADRVSA